MSEGMAGAVKQGGKRMTAFGVLTIVLGVLAMMAPLMAGVSVVMLVGILMLAGGVARMVWAFGSESFGQGALKFGIGLLTLLCGLLMLTRPLLGLASLTLILAAYFLVDGLFEILAAFQIKPETGWGWLLFGGIVSIVLGLMIWRQFPLSGGWAIGVLFGVKLMFSGLEMVTVGSTMRYVGDAAMGGESAPEATDEDE